MEDQEIHNIVEVDKIDSLATKTVVAIDFYRLTDTIDVNQKVTVDNYRFFNWLFDIGFYRLH